VIVVIGSPLGRLQDDGIAASGTPARAALAAAAAGRSVQLVGRTGDDPAADGLLQSLARGGVGHAALLRDPARPTPMELEPARDDADPASADEPEPTARELRERPTLDAADVQLGLRYLTEFAVLVLAEPAGPDVVRVVAEAASWNAARLLMVVEADTVAPDGLPADDEDGAFATFVGRFAAALDEGADPAEAFHSSIESAGWTEADPGEAAAG
jgi:sugar/nucleoside kinase (ribokinase family)